MHLSVAASDKRANSSFSHTKPQRFFVILVQIQHCCISMNNIQVFQCRYLAAILNKVLHLFVPFMHLFAFCTFIMIGCAFV